MKNIFIYSYVNLQNIVYINLHLEPLRVETERFSTTPLCVRAIDSASLS